MNARIITVSLVVIGLVVFLYYQSMTPTVPQGTFVTENNPELQQLFERTEEKEQARLLMIGGKPATLYIAREFLQVEGRTMGGDRCKSYHLVVNSLKEKGTVCRNRWTGEWYAWRGF